jgi:hypothetical protein
MARMTATEIEQLGRSLANDLCTSDPPLVKGPANTVADVIIRTIAGNFAEEAAIERDTQAALKAMGRQADGMDLEKLIPGIRDRIAKQRGFVF